MEITQEQSSDKCCLYMRGDCNIYHAETIKTFLLEVLRTPVSFDVDLSGVTEIDTAGIQVLMAAKNHAKAHGVELRLLGHSPPVLELIEIYDLAAWRGDSLVVAAAATITTATAAA